MHNRAAALFEKATRHPDKAAIIFADRHITYGDLADRVRATAGGLRHAGIGEQARVGVMLPSSPEFVIVQQALYALGATLCPLNIFYRPNEVAHAIASCDLDYLVVAADLLERAPLKASEGSLLRAIIVPDREADSDDGWLLSLPAAILAGEPLQALATCGADCVASLLLTSATTGKAKGVILTAANLAANYDRTPEWLGLDAGAVILCARPLYNTFGLNQCINAMMTTGATMVLLPRFDAEKCIEAIVRHGCTFLPAVPTMLQKIFDHPKAKAGALRAISRISTGAAPVPAALLKRVLAASPGAVVLTGYGLTEGTALVTLAEVRLGPDGQIERDRTIGRVLDGMQLAIMAEDCALLLPGQIGEIVIRGPNVMRGYHKAPEDTASALANGWLHSGDLGYLDEAGYAYIVDRKKDVIIRGGQNIYPADIEEVLYHAPGVAEAAVVGLPDDLLGEVPVAYVALQAGASVSAASLLERCRDELAHYKVPVAVHLQRELPKGPTGKILRRELRTRSNTPA
jgi:long-chain acyl-CoA synthetase